jgi:hypothetical protein
MRSLKRISKQVIINRYHKDVRAVFDRVNDAEIILDAVGDLPEKIKNAAEMYAGCVASAIQMEDYLKIIENSGFKNISLQKKKPIIVPDDILKNYLNEEEIQQYKDSTTRIYSITVYAEKVVGCCTPNSGCC